jgi:hypothetical protein
MKTLRRIIGIFTTMIIRVFGYAFLDRNRTLTSMGKENEKPLMPFVSMPNISQSCGRYSGMRDSSRNFK